MEDLIDKIEFLGELPVLITGGWDKLGEEFKERNQHPGPGISKKNFRPFPKGGIKYAGFFKVKTGKRVKREEIVNFCENLSLLLPNTRGLMALTEFRERVPKNISFYGFDRGGNLLETEGHSSAAILLIDSDEKCYLLTDRADKEILNGSGFVVFSTSSFKHYPLAGLFKELKRQY